MTNQERIEICKTCRNHYNDERYGIMCGVTNNLPHFEDSCRHYSKAAIRQVQQTAAPRSNRSSRKVNRKKSKVSIFWIFFVIWIIYKVIRAVAR